MDDCWLVVTYRQRRPMAVVALVPTDYTGMNITAIANAFARRDPKKEAILERAQAL